ncbi:MAG TPA: LD-carboxypeptidase [Chryseosolibacter sp.]
METFITPPLLLPGDKIAIVAPARKIDMALVDRSVAILQEWGLQVLLSENLSSASHSYLSGTDAQRLADFQRALNDDSIRAILCARGGYGSTRIIDSLDLSNVIRKPKWLIGFSDITSIQLLFLSERIKSIHATMPVLFSRSESVVSVESLYKLLFNGVANLSAASSQFNRPGQAEGIVVGGNLSLIADSLGTQTEITTDNRILIIEEVDEYFYKIDRMLTQLKRAGKLSRLHGLVVGHMTDVKNGELTFASRVEEVVLNAVAEYHFPVAFNFPTGHENPNLAWVQGGHATLSVSADSSELRFSPTRSPS